MPWVLCVVLVFFMLIRSCNSSSREDAFMLKVGELDSRLDSNAAMVSKGKEVDAELLMQLRLQAKHIKDLVNEENLSKERIESINHQLREESTSRQELEILLRQ